MIKKTYSLYQVNAFTDQVFSGNPAGVVPDADGLNATQMQAIARELNNSETVFLLPPDAPDHDIRVRSFTPTVEVPYSGHATIAAHHVLAMVKQLPQKILLQKTLSGIFPVEVYPHKNDYSIMIIHEQVSFHRILQGTYKRMLMTALGVHPNDLIPNCPIQIVSTGYPKVLIPLHSRDRLRKLQPDLHALRDLSSRIQCDGFYVFTLDAENPDVLTHGRMFAPAIGISEDPVTGNAMGPLGAYLVHYRLVSHNGYQLSFIAQQGDEMQRIGMARIIVDIRKEIAVQVSIVGQAVIVFKTEVAL